MLLGYLLSTPGPCPDPLGFLLLAMASGEALHVRTPLRNSMALSKVAGTSVYLKMDNAQPSGSFKLRGIGHFCKTVQDGVLGGSGRTPPTGCGQCCVIKGHQGVPRPYIRLPGARACWSLRPPRADPRARSPARAACGEDTVCTWGSADSWCQRKQSGWEGREELGTGRGRPDPLPVSTVGRAGLRAFRLLFR